MNKKDIAELIDEYCKDIPERMSGNESNPIIAARLENLVRTERAALVDLLRDWIAIRIPQSQRKPGDGKKEGRLWLALEVVERYTLNELRSDIEALIANVRASKTYLPYYAEMIAKYLPTEL